MFFTNLLAPTSPAPPFSDVPRWMDGSFLDLNSESIETEVDEFWREIYKITKVFQIQLKKQRAEESSKLPPGKRIVPIEELAFEDLPPKLRVCNIIQEAIKNFKVRNSVVGEKGESFFLAVAVESLTVVWAQTQYGN